jgi:hypothetical protein
MRNGQCSSSSSRESSGRLWTVDGKGVRERLDAPQPRPIPQQPLLQQYIEFALRPAQRQPRQRDNNEGAIYMMAQDLLRIRTGETVDDINLL